MTRTAVLIGVGAYDSGGFPDLRSPKADLAAIEAALRRNCQFDEVKVLLDPTKARALEAIEAPLEGGGRDDLVFVSFSGHGFVPRRSGRLHLALRDTRKDRPSATAISAVELQNVLRDSPVTSKVLMLDCCYSGAFADGFGTRASDDDPGIDFQRELQGKGVGEGTYVMAACGAYEKAYEGDNSAYTQPSLFSMAVAEGLSGAAGDSNGDGWSDGPDLYQYVHRRVEEAGKQSVTAFALGVTGTIRLARRSGALTATPAGGGGATDGARRQRPADAGDPATPPESLRHVRAARDPDFSRVLDYLRMCVGHESVMQQLPGLDGNEVAACPMGSEPLLTGAGERWPIPGGAALHVAEQAARSGQALRYGYPAVLFNVRGRDTRVAPLFVLDVEAVEAQGQRYLVPVGEPALNRAVLASAGGLAQEDITELVEWFQVDWVRTGIEGLSDKARMVCDRVGLNVLQDLVAGDLHDDLTTTQPFRTGVQNVAILHRANPADTASKQILADLDHRDDNGITLADIPASALSVLDVPLGDPPPGKRRLPTAASPPGPVPPVVTGRSNTAQERIVAEAMTAPLTVVTGAPGTGKSTLITAQVTTAVAAGQSVLIASTNNDAVDVVVDAVNSLVDDSEVIVRTGNAEKRADEAGILTRMRALRVETPQAETTTAGYRLVGIQRGLDEAHARLSRTGDAEHRLAVLAPTRTRLGQRLPRELDTAALGDSASVLYWRERLERAVAPGWSKRLSRWWNGRLVRRGLGVEATSETADALMPFMDVELDWCRAREEAGDTDLSGDGAAEQHRVIARLREERQKPSRTYLVGRFAQKLVAGRSVLDARLQSLHTGKKGWSGVEKLVGTVPAWATTSRSVRGTLPPRAGLFDLVIIDEASQCTAADLVPLLYRARRALVIGDPHQLQPVNTLGEKDDRRIQQVMGLDGDWLDERGLFYTRTSAYHVAAAAVSAVGREVHWLDEHYRCHPDVIAPVNRRFYGDRLSVRTSTPDLAAPTEPAVSWIDVRGRTDRPGGRSCRNTEEAERVVELLRELWRELPRSATMGVVTPFRAQRTRIEGLLTEAAAERIEVGTIHTFQGRECDAVVISPAAATGVNQSTGRWAGRQHNLWNVAVTRAKSRLYIVGDLDYWTKQEGVLADFAVPSADSGETERTREPGQRLFDTLTARGVTARVGVRVRGYTCDIWAHTPSGVRAVLIDDAGVGDPVVVDQGRRLERALDGAALFARVSGVPTVRVPAWRCLAEPGTVADELLG